MSSNYQTYELGQVCKRLRSGKSISTSEVTPKGKVPVIGGNGYRGYTNEHNFDGECAIIGRQGAACGNVRYFAGKAYLTEHAIAVQATSDHNTRYFAYLLSTMQLGRLSAQSAQPGLSVKTLSKQVIKLPSKDIQDKTSELLASLDNKISLNTCINDYLLDLATVLFVEALEDDKELIEFENLAELEDSKRVPLNKHDRESHKGPYPYYGATSIMDYVDDYLFDNIRILLGEDGSVITNDGYPVLQYVWGKYWVNNHAHIIKSKSAFSLEMLYLALRRTSVACIVTGAVQMKISQKNLNKLELEMPRPDALPELAAIFAVYRNNVDESQRLVKLRDTLLPKLMSGEIEVSQVELTQLNNHLHER